LKLLVRMQEEQMQGYRTVIFNAIMALLALVRALFPDLIGLSEDEIRTIFDAIWPAIIVLGNIGLRVFVTKGPVGMKDPECK
jgi:hypothetical protein